MLSKTVFITATQFKNLHDAPQILVPSPGNGRILVAFKAVLQPLFGTTPYTGGSLPHIQLGPPSYEYNTLVFSTAGVNHNPTPFLEAEPTTPDDVWGELTIIENTPLILHVEGADYATGDADFYCTVWYQVAPILH